VPQNKDASGVGCFTLFIDGGCPLCAREGRLLERMDRGRGRLRMMDIAGEEFEAREYGRTHEQFMSAMHGLTAEGEMVTGMEAFRRAYRAVGWGWVLAPTGWPGLRLVFDAGYRWFARNRMRLTGRGGACAVKRAGTG
jgi:predicted DCC family thiol-disulfide oxidoreductase YuxK